MKLRKFQSVLLATSGLLALHPVAQAADSAGAVLGGVVRDSSGVPQMDVLVQLLRADASVLRTVRTDARGHYTIAGITPGIYQLKAIETSFLPTLRENLHLGSHGHTEADLTLSTILEALQWLPAHRRTSSEPEDDWTWTLRSAAYRPLLRFAGEDGVETIEAPENRFHQHHGRLILQSGAQAFADPGACATAELHRADPAGTDTLVRARIGNAPGAPTQLLAAYSNQNAIGSGLSSVVAYESDPFIAGGIRQLRLRTADTLQLTPEITIIGGSQMELLNAGVASTTSFAPFADVSWTNGVMTARYVLATTPQLSNPDDLAAERSLRPLTSIRNGALGLEHGLHQELKLEHSTSTMSASVAVYQDDVRDPFVDGALLGHAAGLSPSGFLFDPVNGIARAGAEDYGSRGVVVEVSKTGPASTRATVAYSSGSALTLRDTQGPAPSFQPEQAEAVALMLEGASVHTGTKWRTSYRWQPSGTVNAVDLFDTGVADAYLSLFLRQSLHLGHVVPGNVEAIVDVRNLLAQGYHPFLTSDGNTLFFAQVDRSVSGGLAFYF